MKKKLVSLISALALLASMAAVPVTAETENDYFWLEAENHTYAAMSAKSNASASGGKFLKASLMSGEYSGVDFNYTVEKENVYDVWMLMQTPKYASMSNVSVYNNDTLLASYTEEADEYTSVYTSDVWSVEFELRWVKVSSNMPLSAGDYTLKYRLAGIERDDKWNGYYNGMIDCAAVIPSSWGWEPSANVEKAVDNNNSVSDIRWLEAEDYVESEPPYVASLTGASAGKVVQMSYNSSSADITIEFPFNVGAEDNYNVYFLMRTRDSGTNQISPIKIAVDDEEEFEYTSQVSKDNGFTPVGIGVSQTLWGAAQELSWCKVMASQSLTAGNHVLKYTISDISALGTSHVNRFMSLLDCIVVVPDSVDWTPTADLTNKPVIDDKYLWLEAEEQPNTIDNTVSLDGASNGKILKADVKTSTQNLTVDFDFRLADTDIYDIWALTHYKEASNTSAIYFNVDGSEAEQYAQKKNIFNPVNVVKNVSFWGGGLPLDLGWVKVASSKALSAGKHNVKYQMAPIAVNTEKCNGMIDCLVVVPKSWGWTPDASLTKPVESVETQSSKAIWIDGVDMNVSKSPFYMQINTTIEGSSDLMPENNKVLYCRYSGSAQSDVELDYDFKVNNTNNYDVWILANTTVNTTSWGIRTVQIDDNAAVEKNLEQIKYTAYTPENEHGHSTYWQRIYSDIELEEGISHIDYNVTQPDSAIKSPMLMLDKIVIVPSDLDWTPSADLLPSQEDEVINSIVIEDKVEGFKITSSDDDTYGGGIMLNGKTYTFSTSYENKSHTDTVTPYLFIARYESEQLISVEMYDYTVAPRTTVDISKNVTATDIDENTIIKAMLFENLETIRPLIPCAELRPENADGTPVYEASELAELEAKYNAKNISGFNIGLITDVQTSALEGYNTYLHHYGSLAKASELIEMDCLADLGDMVMGATSDKVGEVALLAAQSEEMAKAGLPTFRLKGNHDDNRWGVVNAKNADLFISDDEWVEACGVDWANVMEGSTAGEKPYYYKDFADDKIRVVALDTQNIPFTYNEGDELLFTFGFAEEQLNWLANEALDFSDKSDKGEWGVVFLMHAVAADTSNVYNFTAFNTIVKAFQNGTSGTINTESDVVPIDNLAYDFTSQGAMETICILDGHTHKDGYSTYADMPKITTISSLPGNRELKTENEDAWDVVTIDRANRKIYCTRFGAGEDREFGY